MESWKTLLHATCIRNHQKILVVSKEHVGKGFPFVQNHRNCRILFTMKRNLEKIQKSKCKARVLLGHTVLHNNTVVLHYANTCYHVINSSLVVIFHTDFGQNTIFQSKEVPDKLHRLSKKLMPKISPPRPPPTQKYIVYYETIKNKNKKLFSLVSCMRKQKDTGQYILQEPIDDAATAVNDDRIVVLCENYDFLSAEVRYYK